MREILRNNSELPGWLNGKEHACQRRRQSRHGFDPWLRKMPWRRAWQPTPVFLPGESHGHGSLKGYSPWGRKESDTTEQLTVTLISNKLSFGKPRSYSDTNLEASIQREVEANKEKGQITIKEWQEHWRKKTSHQQK